jgi:cytochrome c oxidase subunit 3
MARTADFEIEIEQEPGGPSLPPPPDRGGGDWNPQPQGRPNNRLRRYRIGLLFGVISIYTLFIALTSAYVVRQGGGRFDTTTGEIVYDWHPIRLPAILWLNTGLLLLSSLTLEMARRRVFSESLIMSEWLGLDENTRKGTLPWLGLSAVLGGGFLVGQCLAWRELYLQGIFSGDNPAAAFFIVITGTHAAHLFGGLLSLLWATAGSWVRPLGQSLGSRQIATDLTAWYWHAMGLLWIYILALLHWLG